MKNNFSKSRNFSTYHGRSKAIDSSFNNGIRAPSHFSKPKTKKLIVGVQWEISALNFIFPILQYKPWKSHDLQFLQPQWSPVPTVTWSPVPTATVIHLSQSLPIAVFHWFHHKMRPVFQLLAFSWGRFLLSSLFEEVLGLQEGELAIFFSLISKFLYLFCLASRPLLFWILRA